MSNLNKKMLMKIVLSVSSAGAISTVYHGLADAAQATAQARVVQSAQLYEQTGINFGSITPGNAASTVTIDSAGAVTTTGPVQVMGGQANGIMTVSGQSGSTVTFQMPSSPVTLTSADGLHTMSFTPDQIAPVSLTTGSANVNVAGTLSVGANQQPTLYIATYDINAVYS